MSYEWLDHPIVIIIFIVLMFSLCIVLGTLGGNE